ncbi:MAG: AAA family ATPase [bacterium]
MFFLSYHRMRKLDRIQVENFKSIHNLDLRLNALNVFIGANGSGKSNFIGLFKFLNKLIEKHLQVYTGEQGGADSILYYGRKKSDHLSVKLAFAEETNGYEFILSPTVDDRFIFSDERVLFHDKSRYSHPYSEFLGSGNPEAILPDYAEGRSSRIARYVINDLKSWKLYHFHDTSESARVKQTCDIGDNRIFHPDARNLAAFLYRLKKTNLQHYRNIEDTIRLVAPFFRAFHLESLSLNNQKIMLEWSEEGIDRHFNASNLSDGTLRFICLATLLMQPVLPSVVLLDEPELGLHPYAITILADLLRAASQQAQVLVATQSVTLVNQFEPSQIYVVERKEMQSIFTHLREADIEHWLDEFGLGDLWEKNIFGGRP